MQKDVSNHIMGSQRNADNRSREIYQKVGEKKQDTRKASEKKPSLKTLITWNISKALEGDPEIDLRVALRETQDRLENMHDVEALFSRDERNLCCAFLAWQQLGHRAADSLFDFVQRALKEHERKINAGSLRESITRNYASNNPDFHGVTSRNAAAQKDSCYEAGSQWGGSPKMDFSTSIGLVVKLPVEPQTVMHLTGPVRVPNKMKKCCSRGKSPISGTASKISSACCLDKECMDRLASVETQTQQLRKRAALIARREAERTELLERAEMAWRDLDVGYQRRLRLAKEKEEDFEKQTARLLEERNRYKELCMPMVNTLKKKSEIAEKEREKLTILEQELCMKACARLELLKNDSRANAKLTEHQCKASQLDRDLALKEEQELRKQRALVGAMEAAQVLTHEAEYAQRAELSALKAQVQQAAQELLEEDARATLLKQRIADYMDEKDEMIEDLEACQKKCDGRMGGLVSDLKKKRDQLIELEKKVMECLCKEPVDRAVEVKRTPSLAALCRCSPTDPVQATCSCTSLRSRLLSALLQDLFGGLKSEMETIGTRMPCHLLKCLEDKHNWDRVTDVKKNVRAYFSNLLLGELDIAIATVIENCHAQWTGECCVDRSKPAAPSSSVHSLRWQEHELEMKTHKMATKLAEKMFKEKAQELATQAEEILSKGGRPPCECGLHDASEKSGQNSSAVYRCVVQPHPVRNLNKIKGDVNDAPVKDYRRDKTTMLTQNGHAKKDAAGTATSTLNTFHSTCRSRKKDLQNIRPELISKNNCGASKFAGNQKVLVINGRKPIKSVVNKIESNNVKTYVPSKVIKRPRQYAVNMCLCAGKNNTNWNTESKTSCNQKPVSHVSSLRQSKPAISYNVETNGINGTDAMKLPLCSGKYNCIHKSPSNTSVNRLIGILTKWKDNLVDSQESNIKRALDSDSLFKMTHTSIVNVLQQLCGKLENNESVSELEHPMNGEKNVKPSQISEINTDKVDDCAETIVTSQIQNSESQYMGTINLDRSNSPFCKLGINTEDKEQNTQIPLWRKHSDKGVENYNFILNRSETEKNINNNSSSNKEKNCEIGYPEELPKVNDLKSSKLSHKDCEPYTQFLGVTLTNRNLKQSLSKVANQNKKKPQVDKTGTHILQSHNESDKSKRKDHNERENIIAIIPKECENYIQFLGVVLDNVNVKKMSKQDTKQSSQDRLLEQKINKKSRKSRYAEKRHKVLKVLHLHNECTYKNLYDEVNDLSVKKSLDNKIDKIDKNLNTDFDEPCICCPNSEADDLEVNTFQLLEDHLKCQLEQFKSSVCKSSCMQNSDEKNLLTDTILKVKRLILDTASTVTCKCAGNTQTSEGSWKRAYSLLQEYLKTKIDRVKCLCDTAGQSQEENLVPRVLSKINFLIENDLQKLKNICKCKNRTPLPKSDLEMHINDLSRHMDESKKNDCNNITVHNATEQNCAKYEIVGSMCGNFINPTSIPYNKSAQVSFYHSLVNRSCDAIKTYSQYSEAQTADIMEDNSRIVVENCIISPIVDNDYSNIEGKQASRQYVDEVEIELPKELLFSETEVTVMPITLKSNIDIYNENITENLELNSLTNINVQKQENMENNNEKVFESFLPYVGCTIHCCCDSDLGCVCSRSAVPTNTDWWKNNNIWNTLSKKRNETEKFSYILSHLSNDLLKDDCFTKKSGSKTNICESEVSANEEKDINLKKSEQTLNIVNDTTCTLTDHNSVEFITQPCKLLRHGILKTNKREFVELPSMHLGKSDSTFATDDDCKQSLSTDCDCAMVPVCHVKMLMENIGIELTKAECTCDSLKSVYCPVHFHKSVM